MTCISHNEEPQVLHRLQVADGLACDGVGVLFRLVEELFAGPGGHGLEHLEDADVVADDVKVAVVDQNLEIQFRC